MCIGGSLLADFVAGTVDRPDVHEAVQPHLTQTAEGAWVVWAKKAARIAGDGFLPLTGGEMAYPADAVATCRRGGNHEAPQPLCTCGFHALGNALPPGGAGFYFGQLAHLDVILSGRVLAFTWPGDDYPPNRVLTGRGPTLTRPPEGHASGGVLFRAARQTVVRYALQTSWEEERPDDPGGQLARLQGTQPRGAGPRRLRLPEGTPPVVALDDHAGHCRLSVAPAPQPSARVPSAV